MTAKPHIQMIPIDRIKVLNSRERSEKGFQAVKGNIASVGLKKPVTVRPSDNGNGYDLVCGEGRLKAYIALGQKTIPAIIRHNLSRDDAYVMSLVENMARRNQPPQELMKAIEILHEQGYGVMDISRKIGRGDSYVSGILTLLKKGEERLIAAVERGQVPLSIAIKIASSPGEEQKALQEAYEKEGLRGQKFIAAQRLIEKRRALGKAMKTGQDKTSKGGEALSARKMVEEFKTELDRMRLLVEKANTAESTLMIIIESFFTLLQDENYKTLLRAENLNDMPAVLEQEIEERKQSHG